MTEDGGLQINPLLQILQRFSLFLILSWLIPMDLLGFSTVLLGWPPCPAIPETYSVGEAPGQLGFLLKMIREKHGFDFRHLP